MWGSAGLRQPCSSQRGWAPPGSCGAAARTGKAAFLPESKLPQAVSVRVCAHECARTLLLHGTPTRDGPPDRLSLPLASRGGAGSASPVPGGGQGCISPREVRGTQSPPSVGIPTSQLPTLGLPAKTPSWVLLRPSREGRRGKGHPRGRAEGARLPGSWQRHCSHARCCQSWHSSPAPPLPCGDQGTRNVAVDSVPWGHGFLSQWARVEDGFPSFDPCQLQGAGRAQALPARPQGKLGGGSQAGAPGVPDSPLAGWEVVLAPHLWAQVCAPPSACECHTALPLPQPAGGPGPDSRCRLFPTCQACSDHLPPPPHPLMRPLGWLVMVRALDPRMSWASPLLAKEPTCHSQQADLKASPSPANVLVSCPSQPL